LTPDVGEVAGFTPDVGEVAGFTPELKVLSSNEIYYL
jgi:hypothetical protein